MMPKIASVVGNNLRLCARTEHTFPNLRGKMRETKYIHLACKKWDLKLCPPLMMAIMKKE
jgi:hypothetical protein